MDRVQRFFFILTVAGFLVLIAAVAWSFFN
jgi:hypothetical protein